MGFRLLKRTARREPPTIPSQASSEFAPPVAALFLIKSFDTFDFVSVRAEGHYSGECPSLGRSAHTAVLSCRAVVTPSHTPPQTSARPAPLSLDGGDTVPA